MGEGEQEHVEEMVPVREYGVGHLSTVEVSYLWNNYYVGTYVRTIIIIQKCALFKCNYKPCVLYSG